MSPGDSTYESKDPRNVVRGYKATLHNPRVSDRAKQQAEQRIEELVSQVQTTLGKSRELQQDEARTARETDAKRQIHASPEGINEDLDEQEEPLFIHGEEQEVAEED
ncbi:Conidiation protein 6-domain-containing protein [Umbelopsis sp. AD052]|nr:Conidiation protein 6-domain-containing protein [Umbelopsis sp. AD052]